MRERLAKWIETVKLCERAWSPDVDESHPPWRECRRMLRELVLEMAEARGELLRPGITNGEFVADVATAENRDAFREMSRKSSNGAGLEGEP